MQFQINDEDFQFVMDVNVKGTLNCLRAQVKNMKEAGKSCLLHYLVT